MPSIRKTKKRLKRELALAQKDFAGCDCGTLRGVFLADAIHREMDRIKWELERLKCIRIASRVGFKKRFRYAFSTAVLLAFVMREKEKQMNRLCRCKECEVITGSGGKLTGMRMCGIEKEIEL